MKKAFLSKSKFSGGALERFTRNDKNRTIKNNDSYYCIISIYQVMFMPIFQSNKSKQGYKISIDASVKLKL
jgi:hypothetical protein